MLCIKGTDIRLTRGNSAALDIIPHNGTPDDPIMLKEGDRVLFTIKSSLGSTILQKALTAADQSEDGSVKLVLAPEDTVCIAPKVYTYDVVLVFENGEAYTFIPRSAFEIVEAVGTYKDMEVAK